MTIMSLRAVLTVFITASCATVLAGCGANQGILSGSNVPDGTLGKISGYTFGGQQPISGSHVYVFEIGNTGYPTVGGTGGASVSLLTSTNGTGGQDSNGYYVTTDTNGAFTIASAVVCTTGRQAYLYALGGNPQTSVNSPNNSAAGLLAPLGACASNVVSPPTASININEVSTVVTAYALAGFAMDATHISASSSTLAATGVANAMANALNLLQLSTGKVNTTTNNTVGQIPQAKVNTVANILASCVNSTGPGSSSCATLFGATGVSTSTGDTAGAAIALARAPFLSGTTATNVYNLGSSTYAAFSPTLGSQPADWTLGVQYTGQKNQGLGYYSAAMDSGGNLWVRGTNDTAANPNTTTVFVKYSPTGSQLTGSALTGPANVLSPSIHLAIDSSDTVWAGIAGGMLKLPAGGGYTILSNGTCNIPGSLTSVAFGSDGAVYAGEYGATNLWQFSSVACTSGLVAPGAASLSGYVAIEPDGLIVTAGSTSSNTHTFLYDPSMSSWGAGFDSGGDYVSTDASKNIWQFGLLGGTYYDELFVYPEAGGSSYANFHEGGLTQTGYASERAGNEGVHIDGAGNGWAGVCPNNCGTASALPDIIVGITSTGAGITPSTGLALPNSETGAHALAPDGSGNLWVALADGSLIQYLGLTTPVATPVLYNQIGVRP